jgi:subtilisin family serine protease
VEVAWLDHKTLRVTGNSFAAPHIAGLSALIRSKHPQLRPFQVKTVLWALAANVQEAPLEQAGRLSRSLRATRSAVVGPGRASRALHLGSRGAPF